MTGLTVSRPVTAGGFALLRLVTEACVEEAELAWNLLLAAAWDFCCCGRARTTSSIIFVVTDEK